MTLFCIALATGDRWAVKSYVVYFPINAHDHWIPGVASYVPILEIVESRNGRFQHIDVKYIWQWNKHRRNVYKKHRAYIAYNIVDGSPLFSDEFAENDKATMSVRTIFGYSHFKIKRKGNLVVMERCWSEDKEFVKVGE